MAVTAYKSPGSAANVTGVGTVAWSNTSNGVSSNDSYATAALGSDASSNYLRLYNYDFSEIPAGAAIDGIEIEAEAKGNTASRALLRAYLCTTSGAVAGSSSYVPPSPTTLTTSDALYVAGGASDAWGNSLTDTIVKGSNFGVMLWAEESSGAGSVTVSVDVVRIRVYYTPNNISGDAAITTAAATSSAAGKLPLAAALAVTLGAATVTGASGLRIAGAAAITTAGATGASAGTLPLTAAAAISTGAALVSAVIQLAGVMGAASLTTADATIAAAGGPRVSAASSMVAGDASAAAIATVRLSAASALTTGAATVSAAAIHTIAATLARTTGDATTAAAGTSPRLAALTVTLGAATASATGDITVIAITPPGRRIRFNASGLGGRTIPFDTARRSGRTVTL